MPLLLYRFFSKFFDAYNPFRDRLATMNCVARSSIRPTSSLLFQRPVCRVRAGLPGPLREIHVSNKIKGRSVIVNAAASFPGSSDEDTPIDLLESVETKGMFTFPQTP